MIDIDRAIEIVDSRIVCDAIKNSSEYISIFNRGFSRDSGGVAWSVVIDAQLHKPLHGNHSHNYAILFKVKTTKTNVSRVYFIKHDDFPYILNVLWDHMTQLAEALEEFDEAQGVENKA